MDFKKVLTSFVLFLGILNFNLCPNICYAEDGKHDTMAACDTLRDYERTTLADLSKRFGLSGVDIESVLSFEVSGKNYYLVPLCDCKEHVDCFFRLFVNARPEYMRYYLDGTLRTKGFVIDWVKRSVDRMNASRPKSITFLIRYGDAVIGRIGIGPLCDREGVDTEIGYALEESYSGHGIMSAAVNCVLSFLELLKNEGDDCYDFSRIRATADVRNIPSNKILLSNHFIKSERTIHVGDNKEENEYFFEFG